MLLHVVKLPTTKLGRDVQIFLLELYMYLAIITATSSNDPLSLHLPDELMCMFAEIGASDCGSAGILCGSAHSLFGLIPRVLELQRMIRREIGSEGQPSPSSMLALTSMRQQVSDWVSQSSNPEFTACGKIYQLALLVCLDQAVKNQDISIPYAREYDSSDNIFRDAHILLDALPINASINTTLCWPLAVIASCAETQSQKDFMRDRLAGVYSSAGIGNIRQTLELLDKVWAGDGTEPSGPAGLETGMEKYGGRFSFA